MLLLYCQGGVVVSTHDSEQNIPASAYGSGVTIIPWTSSLNALSRVGSAPPAGSPDSRPYAAPTLSGSSQLLAYANQKQASIAAGGITVNVGGSVGNVEASTDVMSLTVLNGAFTIATANSGATFNWVTNNTSVTLTAAQVITIFTAVSTFIQSTFTALHTAVSGINGATITTQAQVDAVSWPANS